MVDGPYSHHNDLCGLLDRLGIERASFVGCSMRRGSIIDFALRRPRRPRPRAGRLRGKRGRARQGFPKEWDELVAADEAGDLQRLSELEVRIWADGP